MKMRTKMKSIAACIMLALPVLLGACAIDSQGFYVQNGKAWTEAEKPKDLPHAGEVCVLFTGDVHCGVDEGFGYAGLQQVRDNLEAEGYETILVDNGDSIQGEALGTISKGESMIGLMNAMHYDAAIPGNHEFDYGTDRFLELAERAEFPYICCNFTYKGEMVLKPYVILEAAGQKIAFVGVTTPRTLVGSNPLHFQDENGEFVYGFMQDNTGEGVYRAVQEAVNAARAEGADLVYVMAHLGLEASCSPWTYAEVAANTEGIDVFLDGHSHDTEQVVMNNKNGDRVVRSAAGTQLGSIGYSFISASGEVLDTGIWSWPNKTPAPELLGIRSSIREEIDKEKQKLQQMLGEVVAHTDVDLYIYDPVEKDLSGAPLRVVRRGETNLGDLCADAYREQGQADIGLANGGSIRSGISRGDITYEDVLKVFPFSNSMCVLEVSGQQMLDALEWGARMVPEESGAFLQVSGLSYEIHTGIPTPCRKDEKGMCIGIEGERRVKNVMFGDEPLDPDRRYTVSGQEYLLLEQGDGFTMFEGAVVLKNQVKLDSQLLTDHLADALGGRIGTEFADPAGQGRIVISE